MKRPCSECSAPVAACNGKTCSAVCAKDRHARLQRESRHAIAEGRPKASPRTCAYCGAPIPPVRSGQPRATCGTSACKWKHKQAHRPARAVRLVAQLAEDWELDAVVELKRMRLLRAVEMGTFRLMLAGCT